MIEGLRGQAVVVSTSRPLREWCLVSKRRELDVEITDCMDKATGVALGIALACPERRILSLDSDAILRTNTGALITTGGVGPKNLIHFLLEDGDHLSTQGKAIPGLDGMDFSALARGAGYPRVYSFNDLEDLTLSLDEVLRGDGPVFVALRVRYDPGLPPYPRGTLAQSLARVKEVLASE